MWLASLMIGYSLILWKLFSPAIVLVRMRRDDPNWRETLQIMTAGIVANIFGMLFLLLFFTIHFGGFHYVHSIFVNSFYPISSGDGVEITSPDLLDYWQALKSYAWFLPLAFLAQRTMFKLPEPYHEKEHATAKRLAKEEQATTSKDSILQVGQQRPQSRSALGFGEAYKSVVKRHCLIFFLFGADAAGLPEFFSYMVVYLVYFFPWRRMIGVLKSGN